MKKSFSVAVCIDDNGSMLFGGKRQSRDRALIKEFVESVGDRRILINGFSASLFKDYEDVTVCRNPLGKAKNTDVCFIENLPLKPYEKNIDELIIYSWNREYPIGTRLDISPEEIGLTLKEEVDLIGSSHEKITKRIYRK